MHHRRHTSHRLPRTTNEEETTKVLEPWANTRLRYHANMNDRREMYSKRNQYLSQCGHGGCQHCSIRSGGKLTKRVIVQHSSSARAGHMPAPAMKASSCTNHFRKLTLALAKDPEDARHSLFSNKASEMDSGKCTHQHRYRIEDSENSRSEPLKGETNPS